MLSLKKEIRVWLLVFMICLCAYCNCNSIYRAMERSCKKYLGNTIWLHSVYYGIPFGFYCRRGTADSCFLAVNRLFIRYYRYRALVDLL